MEAEEQVKKSGDTETLEKKEVERRKSEETMKHKHH